MQRLDKRHGVADAVEEVRVAEGDVAGAGFDLAFHICQDDVGLNNAEFTLVDGHNRTVTAQVFAAATRLGVADSSRLAVTNHELGVA